VKIYNASMADAPWLEGTGVEKTIMVYAGQEIQGIPPATPPDGERHRLDKEWVKALGRVLEDYSRVVVNLPERGDWNLYNPETRNKAHEQTREWLRYFRTTYKGEVGLYGGHAWLLDWAIRKIDQKPQHEIDRAERNAMEHEAFVTGIYRRVEFLCPSVYLTWLWEGSHPTEEKEAIASSIYGRTAELLHHYGKPIEWFIKPSWHLPEQLRLLAEYDKHVWTSPQEPLTGFEQGCMVGAAV